MTTKHSVWIIVLTDSDADDHKVFWDYKEYFEEEISIEKVCILKSMLLSLFLCLPNIHPFF